MGWDEDRTETMYKKVISWSTWDFGETVLEAGLCRTLLPTPRTCLYCVPWGTVSRGGGGHGYLCQHEPTTASQPRKKALLVSH